MRIDRGYSVRDFLRGMGLINCLKYQGKIKSYKNYKNYRSIGGQSLTEIIDPTRPFHHSPQIDANSLSFGLHLVYHYNEK